MGGKLDVLLALKPYPKFMKSQCDWENIYQLVFTMLDNVVNFESFYLAHPVVVLIDVFKEFKSSLSNWKNESA